MNISLPSLLVLTSLVLTACASSSGPGAPAAVSGPASVPTSAPAQWQAPLPHQGQPVALARWWQQFNDPLLSQMQDAAQALSPTLAGAQSRLVQARAARVAAGGALGPQLNAQASAARGRPDLVQPLGSSVSAGLQAGWELDVFGAGRAARDAAQARLEGAEAVWHDARVLVAADVAGAYVQRRACDAQLIYTEADARSRAETARLTEQAAKAGMQSPANAALARASAALVSSQWLALQAQCSLQLKALVALTGLDEPALAQQLAARVAQMPEPAQLSVASVPAEVLNQRPDLYAAMRQMEAARAELAQTRAARLPRISLQGTIGLMRVQSGGVSLDGSTWSIGPLAVTLPLWDGGTRAANVDAAQARYDEAVLTYRAQARLAVREVESALVQLSSSEARQADVRAAAEGFEASLRATQARYQGGMASLFELEESRRMAAQAQSTWVELQRERVTAWLALYRALGGGWAAPTGATLPVQLARE